MVNDYSSFRTSAKVISEHSEWLKRYDKFLSDTKGENAHYGITLINLRNLAGRAPSAYMKLTEAALAANEDHPDVLGIPEVIMPAQSCSGVIADLVTSRSALPLGGSVDYPIGQDSEFQKLLNQVRFTLAIQKRLSLTRQRSITHSYLRFIEFCFDSNVFPRADTENYALIVDEDPKGEATNVQSICVLSDAHKQPEKASFGYSLSTSMVNSHVGWSGLVKK